MSINLSNVPGTVVAHRPAESGAYIGSPGLARLPDGNLLASHDLFGPGTTLDRTLLYRSSDRGASWTFLVEIAGQWWSSLFLHRDRLYLMGTSRENGLAVIRRSDDGGATWTFPDSPGTGLLFPDGRYHTAPVPVVVHRGRVWRAMEDAMGPGGWGRHFHAFMLSAPEDSDLLRAGSWTATNRLGRDPAWLDGRFGGWLEGNTVVTPEGEVANLLRVDSPDDEERIAWVTMSDDGRRAAFDPETGFLPFPGGAKKFSIRRDPVTRLYWSLANHVPEPFRSGNPAMTRNTLALLASADLRRWEIRSILLQHPDPKTTAFQYADWLFDGGDLLALCRTAHEDGLGGAHNPHDANLLTFHRFPEFRNLGSPVTPLNTEGTE